MATIWMESGTDATQGTEFWTATSIAASTATTPITGPRSILLTNTSVTTSSVTKNTVLADAGRRITFRFMTDAAPGANLAIVQHLNSANSASIFSLFLLTTRKLRLNLPGATSANVDGTTVLNLNTPYRIAISYVITSATVWTFNVFINGVLEITSTNNGTLTNTATANFRLLAGANATITNNRFDDIFIDSGTTLDDPGNIIVTNKRPVSAGAANNWTTQIGSGGSGYGTGHSPQVNEQPLSVTNGWSIASSSLIVEEYTIEGASVGDKDVSNPRYQLVDYMGWVYCKSGTADTRNIIVNGSASNISVLTTNALFTKVAGSTTYPSGNTAIGMNNNSLVALASLFECGILLAYKLPRRVSSCVG